MPDQTLLEMLHRLWLVRDTDIAWEGAPEYDDIHLALIEAGLLEPPPPEPVRWGPVYGPKTRSQVQFDELMRLASSELQRMMPILVPEVWAANCEALGEREGTEVNFHRLPVLSPDGGAH